MRRVLTPRLVLALANAALLSLAAGTASGQTDYRLRLMQPQVQPEAMIGVTTRDAAPDNPEGAVIASVEAGMPAAKAGLKQGDVIVEFDGERVRSSSQLTRLVRETPPDRAVKVAVLRDGKRLELTVTPVASRVRSFLFDVPSPEFREGPLQRPFTPWLDQRPLTSENWWRYGVPTPRNPWLPNSPRLGISLQDLTPQLAEYFGTKDGVLVATVDGGSPAAVAGLKAGDIITSVDKRAVTKTADVQAALQAKRAGDQVTLEIVRDHKPRTITVTLGGAARARGEGR
jgi:serine protease Do